MKHIKRLDPIIDQSIKASFKDGKLVESQANKLMSTFKKISKTEAIYLISGYLKGIKRELSNHTLIIESSVVLSPSERKTVIEKFSNLKISNSEFVVNPQLLGGIKARVADTVYDLSLKGKLVQLKEVIYG